jgi:hypothetical protein
LEDRGDSRRGVRYALLVHREVCVEVFLERRQPASPSKDSFKPKNAMMTSAF